MVVLSSYTSTVIYNLTLTYYIHKFYQPKYYLVDRTILSAIEQDYADLQAEIISKA